ncbi:hypothetical protein [Haloferula sp.]|uniref:hypothetical protein n=1 Tax=Haloferula sp. TaxID=2497595 RepID=UPI0032A0AEDD
MNNSKPFSRTRNQVGFSLMVLGVVLFVAFHFLSSDNFTGWEVWPEIYHEFRSDQILKNHLALLIYSGFISLSLVVLGCPCGIHWILRSRILKWLLAVITLLSAGTIWFLNITHGSSFMNVTLACSPTLTFAGLLYLESKPPPALPEHG